jgi:hypothetical protein
VAALHPAGRLAGSRRKIRAPFILDPTMCFYSPQANADALEHPRVAPWLRFVRDEWLPTEVPGARDRLAVLLPCTRLKPYLTSREHRAINSSLLAAGWRPASEYDGPPELLSSLDEGESADLLATAPLVRDGIVLDRFVISEPLALVPYEHAFFAPESLGGGFSPATSYDDPGLFEARGTSVSPERADCTAVPREDGRWAWGPAERRAYEVVHDVMAEALATSLTRLATSYAEVLAWVSPGLTHRSFLGDLAGRGAVEVLPTPAQGASARLALAERLAAEGRPAGPRSVRAVFARGDGHDTPLGLPELTRVLAERIDRAAAVL